jgi:transposase
MLSKHDSIQRDQLEMITIDQLVPPNHLVRKMEAAIDFTFIYDLVKEMYSEVGRPSIDPVILVKLTFIQYTFGIRSMRKTIEEVETNMAYRWFLGYGFHDKVPHPTPRSGKIMSDALKIQTCLNRFSIAF